MGAGASSASSPHFLFHCPRRLPAQQLLWTASLADFAGPSVPRIRCDGHHQTCWSGGSRGSRGHRHCLDQLLTLLSWPNLPVAAHRPAGGLSLASLSARPRLLGATAGQWSFLPCPFGALPGPVELQLGPWPPKIPCSPLVLSRIFMLACLTVEVERSESVWLTVDVDRRSKFSRKVTWNPRL